jgi:hypothetical protein
MNAGALWIIACGCCGAAFAQPSEKDPIAIVELGGAAGRSLTDRSWNFAPTAAVEVTPIEKWLELEMGVTPIYTRSSTEWDTDLLFKKPWTLSRKVEFMFGVGPQWVHKREAGVVTNAVAGEAVLDFMFWPWANRRFGWYFEPGYEYTFGHAHERSLGFSAGLLIKIGTKKEALSNTATTRRGSRP